MLLIFFFLPAPFPGRETRRDKRETKTHWDNFHKSFLNHCVGHASKTRKLTPVSVWATGSGTTGLFVCPLLLNDIFPKNPTYQGLCQTLLSGFHYINEEKKIYHLLYKAFQRQVLPWYCCSHSQQIYLFHILPHFTPYGTEVDSVDGGLYS